MRRRYQNGNLEIRQRAHGPSVWLFRYWDRAAGGRRVRRGVVVGTTDQYPTEALALKAAEQWRISANAEAPQHRPISFGAVLDRYVEEEMQQRLSTRTHYAPWINNHIRPRWADYVITDVKPFAVREWLKGLALRKKSKQHIRSIMRQAFACAMMWELIEVQENPMSLVRVIAAPDEEPTEKRVLSAEEFQALLKRVPEPFRTMVLVAACMGLRISEILGLQWGDFDWEKLEVRIQRAVVLGEVGKVKTPKSKSIMPLDPDLATVLLDHQRATAAHPTASGWVFANPATGHPWRPSHIQWKYIRPAWWRRAWTESVGTTSATPSAPCSGNWART